MTREELTTRLIQWRDRKGLPPSHAELREMRDAMLAVLAPPADPQAMPTKEQP